MSNIIWTRSQGIFIRKVIFSYNPFSPAIHDEAMITWGKDDVEMLHDDLPSFQSLLSSER